MIHADRIGTVKADREKLKRVLTNIWDNAVKYRDKEQTRIEVNLDRQKEDVILEIADNGQGISSEALPFVFERFYRKTLPAVWLQVEADLDLQSPNKLYGSTVGRSQLRAKRDWAHELLYNCPS